MIFKKLSPKPPWSHCGDVRFTRVLITQEPEQARAKLMEYKLGALHSPWRQFTSKLLHITQNSLEQQLRFLEDTLLRAQHHLNSGQMQDSREMIQCISEWLTV